MSDGNGDESLPTKDVLAELGFRRGHTSVGEGWLLSLQFGEISAVETRNLYMVPIFLVTGVMNNGRTITLVEGQMPLAVASLDQGKAMLSYIINGPWGEGDPQWLRDGKALRHLIPWAGSARR